jgi:hypothetical protein
MVIMRRVYRLTLPLFAFLLIPATNAFALQTRGLWVQFERRGWPVGYWPGQVIQIFNQFDSVVGHNVSDEVALQLDAMRGMGVNTITIELRTADQDGNFTFPTCDIDPALGFQWPQPTTTELTNITPFFDLVHSKGLKIILVLVNTQMEQQPPTNSQLGSAPSSTPSRIILRWIRWCSTAPRAPLDVALDRRIPVRE